MSLHPHALAPVPEDTARVAHAAFPKGNPYLLLRDTLGTIFQDDDFTTLFSLVGQPSLPPWRLALVTIMQFGCPSHTDEFPTAFQRILTFHNTLNAMFLK